jgi:hypothetical protein
MNFVGCSWGVDSYSSDANAAATNLQKKPIYLQGRIIAFSKSFTLLEAMAVSFGNSLL